MRIKLDKEMIYEGNLILINKEYPLNREISSKSLEAYNKLYPDILINREANKYLQKTLEEIEASNKIVPVSGYRTNEEQIKIYEDSIKENGYVFTSKYVANPKSSEHESGLAIDLSINTPNIDFLCPSFPFKGICNKFRNASLKYGFIMRYSIDKENITKIAPEEWHFRYVGYPHSIIMAKYNLALEEYHEYLKKAKIIYHDFEISYVPYKENLWISEKNLYSISGNNFDGFIITRRNDNEK